MRKIFLLLISFSFLMIIGCASSNEQKKDEGEIQKEEYVFDATAVDSTVNPAVVKTDTSAVNEAVKKFVVQIGAFTTKDRADERAEFAKKKLSREIIISYSEEFKLYVVQLTPFATKAEAESVKKELWKTKDFKDAFIVVLP
ncbi:MAG: SPOR domain-containing protein [Ignavibacteriaceae bacterium]|nr:SPOR domain-containing protein [Ignavibacteriaceae bacterium]